MRPLFLFLIAAPFTALGGLAAAQDAAVGAPGPQGASDTAAYLFNSALYFGSGLLVLGMIGGFAAMQAGLAARRDAGAVALRVISILALSAIATWLLGYNLLYGVQPGALLGRFAPWTPADADAIASTSPSTAAWLYRAAVPAIGAIIVAGALGARVRLRALLIFSAAFAGLLYPIEASWSWGGGVIDAAFSFKDFAGASVIHSAGGWAALAGALILGGPRRMRSEASGASPALAVIGAAFVWIGWYGLNAAAEGAFDTVTHANAMAKLTVNTTLAGAGGLATAIVVTQIVYRRIDLAAALAGAIGGLVSVSADPVAPALWQAVIIGAFGGVLVAVGGSFLERLNIEDRTRAIPAHLLCGLWGTLIAPWSSPDASLLDQLVGAAMIGGFVFVMSVLFWVFLKYTLGIRKTADSEHRGLDQTELYFGGAGGEAFHGSDGNG